MATEALVAEQTVEGHVEEIKTSDDVKDTDKESCSESKDLEGIDVEVIKTENFIGAAAPSAEPETTVVSDDKQEDNKSEHAAEEVEKEVAEVEEASDTLNTAAEDEEVDSLTTEPKEEAESAAVEPEAEADVKEPKTHVESIDACEPPQPLTEASIDDSKAISTTDAAAEEANNATSEAAAEEANITPEAGAEEADTNPEAAAEEANNATPEAAAEEANNATPEAVAEEANIPAEAAAEEANATPEATAEEANATPEATAEEANATPEAAADEANATPEAAAEEVNTTLEAAPAEADLTEEFPQVSSVTELTPDDTDTAETLKVESAMVEVDTESQKEEPMVADPSKLEEVSDSSEAVVSERVDTVTVEAAPVKELKEEGEEAAVSEELSNVPQLENILLDVSPVSETVESSAKPDTKVEELQEKAVLAEEPSDITKTDAPPQVIEVASQGSDDVENVEEKNEAPAGEKASEGIEEKMDETLEGVNPALVETARAIDVEEAKNNVSTVTVSPVSETVESSAKPDTKVEELHEKAVLAEEPSDTTKTDAPPQVIEVASQGSDDVQNVGEKNEAPAGEKASEGIEEKKDETLEGVNPALVETARAIDVEEAKNNVNTITDSSVIEKTEKDDEKSRKAETPAKSSQRSIFSKVKQSIVKVKKAIVGKSPSSKTMSAESKEEVKGK